MEHLNHLITHYGYWAVAVGCLLEGETLLILAGIAARRGLLELPWVLAVGACAGALSDVAFFAVGRWRGRAVLARWPKLESYRNRLDAGLSRWGPGMIVGVRFMYGMRIVGPILLGTTQLPWRCSAARPRRSLTAPSAFTPPRRKNSSRCVRCRALKRT